MRFFLYGSSALSVLRYLRKIHDERLFNPACRLKKLSDAAHRLSALAELSFESELLLAHAGDVLHVMVSKDSMRCKTDGFETHLWKTKLFSGAFIRLTDEVYLSSPAFIFLQLSRSLELLELIKVGMELCGYYALPEAKASLPSQNVDETEYGIKAVTNVKTIQDLCDVAIGVHGAKSARSAAAFLADGAASPMESAVYLMLCLPRRLGGYGLPAPVLNPRISLATYGGYEDRFPDLFWRGHMIDVEYESDLGHSGEWKRYKDSKRQVELVTNRITVLPLTRVQVKDVEDFHAFARGLQKLLGLRLRGSDANWVAKRTELRRSLFLQ